MRHVPCNLCFPLTPGMLLGVAGLALLSLTGCSTEQEQAQYELKEKGIPFTAQEAAERVTLGDLDALSLMTTAGLDLRTAQDENGKTLLHTAVEAGQSRSLDYLLATGHDIETPNAEGDTALLAAIRHGHHHLVPKLLATRAQLDVTNQAGLTPLAMAVVQANPKIARQLLDAGADPMSEIAPGCSSLFFAIAYNQSEIVTALLNAGADANRAEPLPAWHRLFAYLEQAQGRAVYGPQLPIDQLLVAGPLNDREQLTALLLRPSATSLAEFEFTSTAQAPIQDLSALALAIRKGDRELTKTLLEKGADANPRQDSHHLAPILLAAIEGDRDIVRALIEHGADIAAEDANGQTALGYAVHHGQPDVIAALVEMGANPNGTAPHGQPYLAAAAAKGDAATVTALIEAGADPNVRLSTPVSQDYLSIARNKHLRKMLTRDSRLTPLMVAASHGDADVVRALLDGGAKKNLMTTSWKFYAINFAVTQNHLDASQLLLGLEPDPSGNQAHVIISLSKQRATLKENGEVVMSSPISTGKRGKRTPTGDYVITNKHRHWTSTIYGSSMPFFMRLNCGSFGLHVGRLPGYPASSGCIRMPYSKARAFYKKLPLGTRVSIVR